MSPRNSHGRQEENNCLLIIPLSLSSPKRCWERLECCGVEFLTRRNLAVCGELYAQEYGPAWAEYG